MIAHGSHVGPRVVPERLRASRSVSNAAAVTFPMIAGAVPLRRAERSASTAPTRPAVSNSTRTDSALVQARTSMSPSMMLLMRSWAGAVSTGNAHRYGSR